MLLDVLGIKEDFSEPYGIHNELSDCLHSQSDLPQHFAGYFCPICQNVNYVDTILELSIVNCWQCQYKGFIPGVTNEDYHLPKGELFEDSGCDCHHCQHSVTGLNKLPTTDECGCSKCLSVAPEPPGSVCPACGSMDLKIDDGTFKCYCGNEGQLEIRMQVTKWPEPGLTPPTISPPTRPINTEELADIQALLKRGAVPDQIQEGEEILVPTFNPIHTNPDNTPEIRARRFKLVDDALAIQARRAIQKEEDQNIFAALKLAADNLADIQKQIEIVSNNPNVTIVCECRWDNTEHLKYKYD